MWPISPTRRSGLRPLAPGWPGWCRGGGRNSNGRRASAEDTATELHRITRDLGRDAEAAGIDWTATDAEAEDVAARVNGRVAARRDDIQAVRQQVDRVARAEQEHARVNEELAAIRIAVTAAESAVSMADAATHEARVFTKVALAGWTDDRAAVLGQIAEPDLHEALTAAVDAAAEDSTETLRDILADRSAVGLDRIRAEAADLAQRRRVLVDRRAEVTAERDRIASERDDAPTPPPTRPADRSDRSGAPLWRLVDFAPEVPAEQAAAVEAALEAAGILDAWVHPNVWCYRHRGQRRRARWLPAPPAQGRASDGPHARRCARSRATCRRSGRHGRRGAGFRSRTG